MKKLIAAILASLLFAPAFAGWIEGSTVGVPDDNAKRPLAVFVSTETSWTAPIISIPANTWVTIDLANGSIWNLNGDTTSYQPNLPSDTKAVFLSGLLVISHPGGSVTCDLWANFRRPGSSLPHDSYQVQTIEATSGAGIRSNAAVWVPVSDRKFQFYWYHTPGCPSLINLSLQAYVR